MALALEDAKARATITYNAAADSYDDPANSFWERFSRRTIERLHLQPGTHVLDVCCGSGASAIPAAEKVGPEGFVLGVDLSEKLLERARSKATKRGLQNVEFRVGDILNLGLPSSEFDAVVCVFGIFFVPDMRAGVQVLWEVVRPGDKLAITTWGPRWFEPATTAFWNSVREVRQDLYKGFNPWDRICDPGSVRSLLAEGGIQEAEVIAEAGQHPVPRSVVVSNSWIWLSRYTRPTRCCTPAEGSHRQPDLHTRFRHHFCGSKRGICHSH